MGDKIQAVDIFQTPLSSHYPLPRSSDVASRACRPQVIRGLRVTGYELKHIKFTPRLGALVSTPLNLFNCVFRNIPYSCNRACKHTLS
jgi:hypothetical protein